MKNKTSCHVTYAFQSESTLYSWMLRNSLLKAGAKSGIKWLQLDVNLEQIRSKTNTQPFSQTGQMIELCSEYLSVWCIWLYVLVMSCISFRVNPHSDSDFVNSHSSFFRYRVWIHSERCMWHDKYIQSNAPYR